MSRRLFDERAYMPVQDVFIEGDPPDGMYLVRADSVEIWRNVDGRRQLAMLEPGTIFGEAALLNDATCMASATVGPVAPP